MKNQYFNVYKNKTVLVTGSSGFKGSWLSLWLTTLGAKVIGYSLEPPTNPSLFNTLGLERRITQYTNDIRNYKDIKNCLELNKPDFVFHLAAQPLVRESYDTPRETFEVNVMGTVNLLEALRELKLTSTVICITSDKSYENKEWLYGYREEDPMGGHDPYSASKGAAELVISSYQNSFFNPSTSKEKQSIKLASVRAGNVIGGGDWAKDRIVPDCIRSLQNKHSIFIRNPLARRPWQHVLEPLGGYLLLGAYLDMAKEPDEIELYSSAFNFGPNITSNKQVGNLVKEIIRHWGSGDWHHESVDAVHEASLLNLTIDKAYHLLDWHPVWGFEKTVGETVEWYRTFFYEPEKIESLTQDQILRYQNELLSY